ncbi:PREDICTED: trafficking protein particle complex subunit 11-like, partial [Amphimedon queenslandica]|uniref:Uncharacterized protein n=1 Tax=Amphimedon queenslandica TaxID=400682 RepID=A0AAN0K2T5_AMPQE
MCLKEEMLMVETVTPLRVSHKIMNMKFQPTDVVFFDEPFLLQSSIHSLSPWQLLLGDTRYQMNKSVVTLDQDDLPGVKD